MYDSGDEEGSIMVPPDNYYGELKFTVYYKEWASEPFDWLYLDPQTFKDACLDNGLSFEILGEGENFDYLAKLTLI